MRSLGTHSRYYDARVRRDALEIASHVKVELISVETHKVDHETIRRSHAPAFEFAENGLRVARADTGAYTADGGL
jgi:hypothetical protein